MPSFFITGTDTGVGKTLVAGAVARALARSGTAVGVMKPFETGCTLQGGELVAEDALFLKTMAGCGEDIAAICPFRMQRPLAPLVAAGIENVSVDVETVRSIFQQLRRRYAAVLAEGAGGLMVPLAENVLTIDLIRLLGVPAVVVARLSLGTINHTLLTVGQARASGIDVAGIVLNQLSPETGMAEETNPEVIEQLSRVPVLGCMPFVVEHKRSDAGYLADLAEEHLDMSVFRET